MYYFLPKEPIYMDMSVLSDIGMTAGVILTLSSITYFVYKLVKRIEEVVGVDSQGRTLADRMDRVEYQLWENGGDSLKDQVNSIEMLARETAVEVRFIRDIVVSSSQSLEEPIRKTKKSSKNTIK
jgi:hypothetical protein